MKTKPSLATLALTAITLTLTPARAADGTWLGTSGNWSATTTWSGGIADGTNSTANFTGVNIAADQTITVDGPRIIGNITFTDATTASHNLTLSGANALTLDVTTGAPVLNVTNQTLIIGSEVAGNDGFTKSGAGQLTLSGSNTSFSGPVTVNTGILALGSTSALGSASGLTLAGGTKLNPTVDGVTLSAPISLGAAGTTSTIEAPTTPGTGGTVFTLTLNGAISGSGNLTLSGSVGTNTYGTIVLGAASNYTGSTLFTCTGASAPGANFFGKLGVENALPTTTVLTLDGGIGSGSGRTLQLDLNGKNQTLAGLTNIARNLRIQRVANTSVTAATLTIDNTADYSFSAQLGSNGTNFGLTKSGIGTFTLSAVNTYNGATTINNGKLVGVTAGSSSASSVTVVNTTAALGVAITDNTKVWTCNNLTVAAGALDFNFGGVNPSATVAPLVVTNAVNFTTAPTVFARGASLSALSLGSYPLMRWTTVTGTVPTAVNLPPTMDGNLSVTGNTLYLNITKVSTLPLHWAVGDGAWDINTSFNWKDNGGTTTTYQENLAGAAAVVFDDIDNGPGPEIAVSVPADVAPASMTFDNSSKNFTLSGPGVIGGATGLTKTGTGTLTLATATTYSGATAITGGTLKLGAANRLPDGTGKGNVTVAGTLDLNGFSETVNGLSGTGTVDTTSAGSPILSVGNASATSTFGGVIQNTAGSLALAKTGTGTLTLTGINTYSGGTEITGGVLSMTNASALGSGTVTINDISQLMVEQVTGTIPNNLTLAGTTAPGPYGTGALMFHNDGKTATLSGTVTLAGDTKIRHYSAGGTTIFNNPIGGTGSLTFEAGGAATTHDQYWVLKGGASTYAGDTTITSPYAGNAIVRLEGGALPSAWMLSLRDGNASSKHNNAVFDLNGYNQTLSGLTDQAVTGGGGRFVMNSSATLSTLTINSATDSAYAGVIGLNLPGATGQSAGSGNIALVKTGPGTLTLSGANTYTGNTTVIAGTLGLADNAQLKFVLGASSGVSNRLTGIGAVILDGDFVIDTSAADALASGSWTLENVSTLTGAYGSTFTVVGFVDAGSNQWTKAYGEKTYSFDETTGILTLVSSSGGFSAWITGDFTNGMIPLDKQGPSNDFDNDGISNLIEYAVAGQDPTVPNPAIGTFIANKLSFAKRTEASGLTYLIQESTDLGFTDVWAEVGSYDENNSTTISHTLTPGAPPRSFLRLQVLSN